MSSGNFRVYKSSAGSGKTYTLVKEYLRLALRGGVDTYKSILAITFTNKAANEMKERVLEALRAFSTANTPDKFQALFKEFQTELSISETDLRLKSSAIFTSILHNYADFSISTIDKFSHKIVRTFAYDLKLNVGFDVELDEDVLLKRAIDQLIEKAGSDKSLTDLLLYFTEQKIDKEGHWQIENDLLSFSKILLREADPDLLDELREFKTEDFFKAGEVLRDIIQEFKAPLKELARQTKTVIDGHHIDPSNLSGGAKSGLYRYLEYLLDDNLEKYKPTSTVHKSIGKESYAATKASREEKEVISGIQAELSSRFNELLSFVEQHYEEVYAAHLIEKNLLQTALLTSIEEELEQVKKEQNIIPISDFNKSISDVVARQPVPFIYERIGEKYKHYLIDEFQDTSVMQWQNLLPLIENSLGNGQFNMIVGDEKQAIYRFRGGEVEQFTSLPEIYAPRNPEFANFWKEALTQNIEFRSLSRNWRSKQEVISFNNEFFKYCATELSGHHGKNYQNAEQEFNPDKSGGGVEVSFFNDENEGDFTEFNLNRVEEIIQEVLADGYYYEDIAILTQTNNKSAQVASHLSSLDIPVISSDSLKINASSKVNTLVHLMYLIVNPANHFHAVKLAEYLHEFFQLGQDSSDYPLKIMQGEVEIFTLMNEARIQINRQELTYLPIYECFEHLMREFGWMEAADGYLQSFLDVVLKFTSKQGNDKAEFLSWWETNAGKFSVKVPDGIKAVTVLSVHKSKGLEFPVVIHPFANYKARRSSDLLQWIPVSPDLIPPFLHTLIGVNDSLKGSKFEYLLENEVASSELDVLNVLYVALTRAAHRLYAISSMGGNKSNSLSVNNLFQSFCEGLNGIDENGRYRSGAFNRKEETNEKTDDVIQLKSFVSNDWRGKLKISYRSEELWDEANSGALSYGNLIHDVLSRIESREDTGHAVRELLLEGLITEEESVELSKKLSTLLENERIKPYYQKGAKVKNESFIVMPDGEGFRPDRLVFNETNVVIIDYKTGLKNDSHQAQVKKYSKVLEEMGYSVKEALLVYIGLENEIVEVH